MNDDQLDDQLRDVARSYNTPPPVPRDLMWARIEAARRAAATPGGVPLGGRRTPWLRTAAGIAAVLLVGIAIGRFTNAGPADVALRVASAPASSIPTPHPAVDSLLARAEAREGDDRSPGAARDAAASRDVAPPSPRATFASRGARGGVPIRRLPGSTYGVPRSTPGVIGEGTGMNAHRLAVVEHLARTEVLLTGFRARELSMSSRTATAADAEQFGRLSRELLQNTRLLLTTGATDDPLLTRLLEDLELVLMQISQYAAEGGARRSDLDAINHSLDRRNVLPKLRSTIPAGAPAPAGT